MPKLNDEELIEQSREYIRSWLTITQTWRNEVRKDYEYVDSEQWSETDRAQVESSGRPALTFNRIRPQVNLVRGVQRGMDVDFLARPRGGEDKRLSEVATSSLKAAADFTRLRRPKDKMFDDSIIGGLGVVEIVHTMDDADDILWGDIRVSRISPLAFVWDPWAIQPDWQDGLFMGKASWVTEAALIEMFPKKRAAIKAMFLSNGEWLSSTTGVEDSRALGLGESFIGEIYDKKTGRIRLLTIWDKRQIEIALVADMETGRVSEMRNEDDAHAVVAEMKRRGGQQAVEGLQVVRADTEVLIVNVETQQPMVGPDGQPLRFLDEKGAQDQLEQISKQAGIEIMEQFQVIARKARRPYWTQLVWWQLLDKGESPFDDNKYPFVPYIGEQFADDPKSIMGIVRPVRDAQDEYNKRYSQLLAHLNSSAHSGWLNKKMVGADTNKLQLMGAKPGIVVEYSSVPPVQIKPTEISQGHFALLGTSDENIRNGTGVNNELVGNTTQVTVSGKAIRARQQGGLNVLQPRFRNYEEAELDIGSMQLSRVQQFYPPEKIRRIIGVAELQTENNPEQIPLFMGMSDDQVIAELKQLKATRFDLVLQTVPATATERQARFERGMELINLMVQSGRPVGQATMATLLKMSDAPTELGEAVKIDMQQPPNPELAGGGGGTPARTPTESA